VIQVGVVQRIGQMGDSKKRGNQSRQDFLHPTGVVPRPSKGRNVQFGVALVIRRRKEKVKGAHILRSRGKVFGGERETG